MTLPIKGHSDEFFSKPVGPLGRGSAETHDLDHTTASE